MLRLETLFGALNEAKVEYLLIGGLASVLYGVPRTTVDIDITISVSKKNVKGIVTVLKGFGLTSDTEDFEDIIAQGGITFSNEREVDVLTSLPGDIEFAEIWMRRNKVDYHGTFVNVISREDQVRLLRKTGRKQDLEDAGILERL